MTPPEFLCISQRTNWSQPPTVLYQLKAAQNTIMRRKRRCSSSHNHLTAEDHLQPSQQLMTGYQTNQKATPIQFPFKMADCASDCIVNWWPGSGHIMGKSSFAIFFWWAGQEGEGKIYMDTMDSFCAIRRNVGGSNLIGPFKSSMWPAFQLYKVCILVCLWQ